MLSLITITGNTQKEKTDLLKSGSERVLVDVISVVDDFDRALENISKTEECRSCKRRRWIDIQ